MQSKLTQYLNQIRLEYGDEAPAQYLRYRLGLPQYIHEWPNYFPNHTTSKSPPFHVELLKDIDVGGRLAIAAPRGFAKSTSIDIFGVARFAIYSRYHFILIIADTYTQAKMQLGALKSELEGNEILKEIYGNLVGSVWGEDRIIVNGLGGECMIMALGAGMKIRGLRFNQYRPELVILDDLENQEMVASKERRDKLMRWLLYDVIPALSKDNNNIIYIGTILHHAALLKKVLDGEGAFASWRRKRYQALSDGVSLWPDKYPVEKLIAMRDDPNNPEYVGSLIFAQEYQNEPQDDHDRLFKLEWLSNRYKLAQLQHEWQMQNPQNPPEDFFTMFFSKIITGVDPAISEKTTADYFAMKTIGIARADGHIYTLDYFRDRIGDPLKQVEAVINNYLTWKPDKVMVEIVAYQQGLYNLIKNESAKRNIYIPLSPYKPDKDKVRRAIIHSASFSGGLVHLREDHPLFQAFYDELVQFPLGEHDDMLDAYMNAAEEAVAKPRARVFSQKPSMFR